MKIECRSNAPKVRKFEKSQCVKLFYLAKDERCSCLWTRKCFSLNFFDIEKNTVLEKKVFDSPKKSWKARFFCIMQIFKTLFNEPQFYRRMDVTKICHLNPVLLIIPYCNIKFTFHGCNLFTFDRFRSKCSCSEMPISINSIRQSRFYFIKIFISELFLVFLDGPYLVCVSHKKVIKTYLL